MSLPSSGQISFAQLAAELGNSCSNVDLRSYSVCANLTVPDGIDELYGCQCLPIYGTGTWSGRNSLATARQGLAGADAQNSALAFGGYPTTNTTDLQYYLARYQRDNRYYNGTIYEHRLCNRTLNSTEVTCNWNETKSRYGC